MPTSASRVDAPMPGWSAGRKPKQKRDFYARAAELLAQEPGLKPQELFINLVEVVWENWSFGNGKSQYTE